MSRLEGKVAVVVGGGTGFGLATSKLFAAEGAKVVVVGRRGDLAADIGRSLGGSGHACDITDFDQLERVTADIVSANGGIDVAVNYAGFQQRTEIKDLTPEILRPMVEVQLIAAIWFIRAMGNAMSSGSGGSIISTSSLTAWNPSAGQAAYAGSKKGLEYVSQIAAVEYGPADVRVNCIAAHLIETPMTAEIFRSSLVIEAVKQQTPLGRMGTVDDIANAALFLASDEANYISGQTICVDGAASTQKLPTANDLRMVAATNPDLR